jgi:hypothetical protein
MHQPESMTKALSQFCLALGMRLYGIVARPPAGKQSGVHKIAFEDNRGQPVRVEALNAREWGMLLMKCQAMAIPKKQTLSPRACWPATGSLGRVVAAHYGDTLRPSGSRG